MRGVEPTQSNCHLGLLQGSKTIQRSKRVVSRKYRYCGGAYLFAKYVGTCFTVAPVRHKFVVLYVEKSTSYLDLKCADTFKG